MVSTIQRDIERLRTATGNGGGFPPCPECGWGGGDEPFDIEPGDTFELIFVGPEDLDEVDEYCPECDRRIEINIRFDDDGDDGDAQHGR